MKSGEAVTVKIVGYHPANPARRGLPTILSTVLCFDVTSGHLRAVIDGNFLTAIRTGAASAVASRVLARPDTTILGLIGCGAQAVSQLHALSRVFPLKQVLVYDTDPVAQESFRARTEALSLAGIDIRPVPLDTVVCTAEVLCTATSVDIGCGPVFSDRLLRSNVHINAVGSDFPGKTELPQSLLARSLVCPDFHPQAVKEGECQQLDPEQIGPDLIALVQQAESFAEYRERCTVFDSTGWAIEDYVTVNLLLQYGRDLGCVTRVDLADLTQDPHNPYAGLTLTPGADRCAV